MSEQDETAVQEVTMVSAPSSQNVIRKTKVVIPLSGTGVKHEDYQAKKAIFRTYQVIWYILGVIEVILGFRILLKFLGADPGSGFTNFIYVLSSPLALPFVGILGVTGISDMVFEWSTFLAMIVYAIIAYGIVALFQLVKPTNPSEVEKTVDSV